MALFFILIYKKSNKYHKKKCLKIFFIKNLFIFAEIITLFLVV